MSYLLTGVCLLLAIAYVGWTAGILWTIHRLTVEDLNARDTWANEYERTHKGEA